MTPRSIRRAAERKALKDARKSVRLTESAALTPEPMDEAALFSEPKTQLDEAALFSEPKTQRSQARLTANAANAQLSTGPRTPQGKAKSSVNAVKTALTGRTVLLPTDDVAAYQEYVQIYADEFQPVGPRESELVQALADHGWRLKRIASLEMAIYAFGYEQFAEQFADRGDLQGDYAQMHTFLHYEKQLRNLQLQDARIRRNREKDTAELKRLQQDRLQTATAPSRAASVSESVTPSGIAPNVGFEFSFPPEPGADEVEWLPLNSPLALSFRPKRASEAHTAA